MYKNQLYLYMFAMGISEIKLRKQSHYNNKTNKILGNKFNKSARCVHWKLENITEINKERPKYVERHSVLIDWEIWYFKDGNTL